MKTPIALHNLWHQGAKTLVSIGGVAFALLLVFMQLGFMGAVEHTAKNVLEKLDFDILIRASDYLHLYEANYFDRDWLTVAESTDGVASAQPMWVMIHNWRKLPNREEMQLPTETQKAVADDTIQEQAEAFVSQYLPIAVMAFDPDDPPFLPHQVPEVREFAEPLHRIDTVLLDDATKADYGPWNGSKFTAEDVALSQDPNWPDRRPEIGGVEFEITGLFKLGTGLAANAAAIMGHRAFEQISPWDIHETASLGLIKLMRSQPEEDLRSEDVEHVLALLRSRLSINTGSSGNGARSPGMALADMNGPQDSQLKPAVSILSREEAIQAENDRWLWDMPIGLIFQMGVAISLLVGAAIVYMVLSTDVSNRLPEYATLLAMGYSRGYLASIVMTQAIVLCALGFMSALVLAEVLYRVTSAFSGIPLNMEPFNILLVGVLGLAMCCVSALLALRKLWKAEPANLF